MQLAELYRLITRPAFIAAGRWRNGQCWNSAVRRQYIELESVYGDNHARRICTGTLRSAGAGLTGVYDGESYPASSHCICCNFSRTDLQGMGVSGMPRCSWNSVIYVPGTQGQEYAFAILVITAEEDLFQWSRANAVGSDGRTLQ